MEFAVPQLFDVALQLAPCKRRQTDSDGGLLVTLSAFVAALEWANGRCTLGVVSWEPLRPTPPLRQVTSLLRGLSPRPRASLGLDPARCSVPRLRCIDRGWARF